MIQISVERDRHTSWRSDYAAEAIAELLDLDWGEALLQGTHGVDEREEAAPAAESRSRASRSCAGTVEEGVE